MGTGRDGSPARVPEAPTATAWELLLPEPSPARPVTSPDMRSASSLSPAPAARAMVSSGLCDCACSCRRTCSARCASLTRANAWMTSMRISFSGRVSSGSNSSTMRASPSLPTACTTMGMARGGEVCSISVSRGSARLLPMSASASTARSLTHQSGSLVASIRLLTARSSLVWFRISIAARRMLSSRSRTSSSTASMTLGPPILPRHRRATAHPPVRRP